MLVCPVQYLEASPRHQDCPFVSKPFYSQSIHRSSPFAHSITYSYALGTIQLWPEPSTQIQPPLDTDVTGQASQKTATQSDNASVEQV